MADITLKQVREKFPQYNDLSDEQLAKGLHEAYYSDMPFDVFASRIGYTPPTAMDTAGRYAGLAGRTVVQAAPSAVLGLPALAMDAYDALRNLTALGINKAAEATGINARAGYVEPWRNTRNVARAGEVAADALGLPQAQTPGEKKAVQYGTALGSTLGAAGGAKAAATALRGLPASAPLGLLAEHPVQQAVGTGASTATANYIAENPDLQKMLGPGGTALAVLGAGTVAPSVGSTSANVARRGAQFVAPFSDAGQRAIAGTILRKFATNPDQAQFNLGQASDTLPGSRMTTGEVAGDAGLAGAQGPILKGLDTRNLAGERASERNAARVAELRRVAGANVRQDGQTGLEYAQAKREAVATPMREEAFANASVPPDVFNSATTAAVESTINRILSSNVGTRKNVQEAMAFVRQRLEQGVDTPERLYSIRKDLREASLGKFDPRDAQAGMRLAKGELEDVIRSIDTVIEAAAPGYQKYLAKYAQMSKPIDQMEILDHLRRSAESATVDVTRSGGSAAQFPVLMAGKLNSALNSKMMEKEGVKLSSAQQTILDKVFADMRSEMSVTGGNRMVRQPGSDTFKNMSMANIVGHIMGDYLGSTQAAKTITAPMQWLYKLPDNRVADLLVEAMLDPKMARDLLSQASTVKIQKFSEALKNKAIAQGLINQAGEYINPGQPGTE